MRLSPIDPATAYAKRNTPNPTQEQIAALRVQMGLDKPLPIQYGMWLEDALRLDFGKSLLNGKDALQETAQVLPVTLGVVLLSSLLQIVGAVFLGGLLYLLKGRISGWVLKLIALCFVSIPAFYIANVYLNFFAVQTGIISVTENTGFFRYFHPALCLSIPYIAFYGRLLYTALCKEMGEDYAFYARCRGLSEARILVRHAVPHAFIALLPNFMQSIGLTMAGAAFVERIFSLPGLGYLVIDSVMHRDSPVVHLCVLVLALALVFFNVVSDLLRLLLEKGNRRRTEMTA
jgi:ABC-type dipeptide/oligopeptide/nickel transport system permease component